MSRKMRAFSARPRHESNYQPLKTPFAWRGESARRLEKQLPHDIAIEASRLVCVTRVLIITGCFIRANAQGGRFVACAAFVSP